MNLVKLSSRPTCRLSAFGQSIGQITKAFDVIIDLLRGLPTIICSELIDKERGRLKEEAMFVPIVMSRHLIQNSWVSRDNIDEIGEGTLMP